MGAENKRIVVIGESGSGKSTLVNALLRWDILPQAVDGMERPTEACVTLPLAEGIQITDTPGYDAKTGRIQPEVRQALSGADQIIVVLDEKTTGIGWYPHELTALRKTHRARHRAFLKQLLRDAGTNRVWFVIPYDTEEWEDGTLPARRLCRQAANGFAALSNRGRRAFFCIDSLQALIGEIEADEQAIDRSGIRALRAVLLEEKGGKRPWIRL